MLLAGACLYPSVYEWPGDFFQVLRWIVTPILIILAFHAIKSRSAIWAIFAIFGTFIFNPIFPFFEGKSWDFFGAVYALGISFFGLGMIDFRISKFFLGAFAAIGLALIALTFYVNHYMPRGEIRHSGEIVCENEGHGKCVDEIIEDISSLDIPHWAKFLRSNSGWTFIYFGMAGIFLYTVNRENSIIYKDIKSARRDE